MVICFIVGHIFVIVGIVLYFQEKKKQENCFYRQVAIFENYEQEITEDSDGFATTIFYPVFNYNFNNDEYTEKYDFGTSSRPYKKGDEVLIEINPDKPEEYVIVNKKTSSKLLAIIIALIGVMVIIVPFIK